MPAATRLLFLTGWGVATGLLFWTPLAMLFGLSEEARRLGRVFDLVRPTGFFLTGCSDDLGFSNRPRLSANIDLNADCNIKGMQHSQLFLVDIPPELKWMSLFLYMVQAILLPWNMSTLKSDKCSQTWNVYFGVLVTCGLLDVGTVWPNFGLLSTADAFRLIWLPLKDLVAIATFWFVVCLVILATWTGGGGDVVGGVNLTRTKQKILSWIDWLGHPNC